MLINQVPADWYNLIDPLNKIWEVLEKTQDKLGILTNYMDYLERRVKAIEVYNQRMETFKKNKQKSEHWVTVAKRDLATIKERRKQEGQSTKLKLKGLELYREVVKYKKFRNDKNPEALKILNRIFV